MKLIKFFIYCTCTWSIFKPDFLENGTPYGKILFSSSDLFLQVESYPGCKIRFGEQIPVYNKKQKGDTIELQKKALQIP